MVNKYILEGTDGVGKSSTIKELLKDGIVCDDRNKDIISKYMLFDVDMYSRAKKYEEFLRTSNVKVIFMINNDEKEIMRRIYSRDKISEFDKKANQYNKLYLDTYNYMVDHNMTNNNLILLDCTNLTFEEQVNKVKEIIRGIQNT